MCQTAMASIPAQAHAEAPPLCLCTGAAAGVELHQAAARSLRQVFQRFLPPPGLIQGAHEGAEADRVRSQAGAEHRIQHIQG